MAELDPAHVRWQKQLLDMLKVGGVWAIPMTGAIVRKVADNAVTITGLDPGNLVRQHIEAAGYRVQDQPPKEETDGEVRQ